MNKLQTIAEAILDVESDKKSQLLRFWGFVQDFAQERFSINLSVKDSSTIINVITRWEGLVTRKLVKAQTASFDYKVHVLDRLETH